jgi:hypothetical protein
MNACKLIIPNGITPTMIAFYEPKQESGVGGSGGIDSSRGVYGLSITA